MTFRAVSMSRLWKWIGTIACVVASALMLNVAGAGQAGESDDGSTQQWDFGFVPQRAVVSHTFHLHNYTQSPLSVTKIDAGCSCTSVSESKEPIAPGDSSAVTVSFKSGRYSGVVRKTTRVYTDSPEFPVFNLQIVTSVLKKGERPGKLELSADRFRLEPSADRPTTDRVTITNNGEDTLQVAVLQIPEFCAEGWSSSPGLAPGESADFSLRLPAQRETAQGANDALTLSFTGNDTTIITLPIEVVK